MSDKGGHICLTISLTSCCWPMKSNLTVGDVVTTCYSRKKVVGSFRPKNMKVYTRSVIKKNYRRRTYSKSAKAKGAILQRSLRMHSNKVASGMKVQRSYSVPGDVHSAALIRGSNINEASPTDGSGAQTCTRSRI